MSRAIGVEDLWLSYPDKRMRPHTLKLRLAGVGRGVSAQRWALQGVNLEVQAGEMLGVIGHNGSGKSTLLRCLAGIFRPSRGSVAVRGRTASLIDLTAGFHRLLSARENVVLAGSIYGMPRVDMQARFPEIMNFAGLEGEENTAMRAFSTGMAMRLGFSVAVAMEPDVLLVDEVLAVGDEAFKLKCLDKVAELRAGGTTIVFVSHELAIVRSLSDRVLVLDEGRVLLEDSPPEAIDAYCEHLGIEVDEALSRPLVEPDRLDRLELSWKTGKRHRP